MGPVVDTAVPESLPRTQQARRQRIIAAAVELLEDGEYDTVQMRDVAERAGVALATIYRYFTSKEHLYAAALLDWAADYPVKGRLERSNGGDEARFRALMRRAVRAFERHPQMMRALIVLESSNDPNARALFQEFAKRNTDTLTAALGGMDAATATAVVETANAVMVTRLRSWALGRCSIRDVDRSVQRALDLVFS
jgi:TetR/AcrR family transcriptional regulator, cholesterol catabolism regulator